MKRTLLASAILALMTLPTAAPALAASDHTGHAMDHSSMAMPPAATMMLGEQTVDGVKGRAHLNDVGAMMAQMGRKENYHFMIMFSDAKTGAAMEEGTVAVKIIDGKTGQAGEPIALMGMGNHFGADIVLPAKGEYGFQVGSKLRDGAKRQFTFHYTVK
jgi:hypothetical protein